MWRKKRAKGLITKEITIEELIRSYPVSVRFLMEKGIKCIACGEAVWGTLESNARDKGFDEAQIEVIVGELNALITEKS